MRGVTGVEGGDGSGGGGRMGMSYEELVRRGVRVDGDDGASLDRFEPARDRCANEGVFGDAGMVSSNGGTGTSGGDQTVIVGERATSSEMKGRCQG